jgi:hypothetical protein
MKFRLSIEVVFPPCLIDANRFVGEPLPTSFFTEADCLHTQPALRPHRQVCGTLGHDLAVYHDVHVATFMFRTALRGVHSARNA